MLTFIWVVAVVILVLVGLFAYSSRNKKSALQSARGDERTTPATNSDVAMSPDRKRAVGIGDN